MRRIAALLPLCLAALPLLAQVAGGYHILQTFALGGDGGWDYIVPEPAQHRLFIGRTNRVMEEKLSKVALLLSCLVARVHRPVWLLWQWDLGIGCWNL